MSKSLNPKQLKFVERYLATGNATQSYLDAGYAARGESAKAAACRLLTDAHVKAAIDAARAKGAEQAEVNAAWVFARLKVAIERTDSGASHAAQVKAIELLAKLLGMFTEKVDVTSGGRALPQAGSRAQITLADIEAARAILGIPNNIGDRIDHLTKAFECAADREAGDKAELPERQP